MKRFARILITAIVIVSMLPVSASGSAAGVEKKSVTIGGNSATLITIDMNGRRTGELTIGQGSVNKDMPASQHVSEIKAEKGKSLIASINGGFFNSYYSTSKPLSYPDNCAKIYATLVDNGEVIEGGGKSPMLAFTSDGKALIDYVNVVIKAEYRNKDSATIWSVNRYYSDPGAIMLFTDKMGYTVNFPSSSKFVYIKNNIVTKITPGGTLELLQPGTQVLVYNSTAWDNSSKYFIEPREGNYIRIVTEYVPDREEKASDWAKITCGVGCEPWLLQGGKDVTSRNTSTDPKLQLNTVAARSFAAIMPDGKLILGAATASFRAITDYLKSVGAVDAIALDGGASSTLYMEGSGFVRPAGRKLANVLHIVEYTSNLPAPASVPDVSTPSSWSSDKIAMANKLGILPDGFDTKYRTNITRSEFCELVIGLIKLNKGDKYNSLIYSTGVSYEEARARFIDTYNLSVLDCSRLDIVSGKGNKRFDPNGSLTRQEAAVILKKVANIIGFTAKGEPMTFEDSSLISSWALDGVNFVTSAGIMYGKGKIFDPRGYFTKEEAIVTITRFLQ